MFKNHLVQSHKMSFPAPTTEEGKMAYGAAPTIQGPRVEGAYGTEIHGRKHGREKPKGAYPENVELRCPVDGALIVAADEDEASELVKSHMKGEHNL